MKSPAVFSGVSWGITILVVLSLLGATIWHILPHSVSAAPVPTPIPTEEDVTPVLSAMGSPVVDAEAIVRYVALKTDISKKANYGISEYRVESGDALFSIAKKYNVKPETVLWANYDILQDSPDSLRVGQELQIPPVDGVYYKVEEGDTLASIAEKFSASTEDVLSWPGNDIDLTDPKVQPGSYIMVPGGHREFVQWIIPTVARGRSGTANIGGSSCGGGPVGSTAFIFPTGNHTLSGNDYWSGHLGIDLAAGLGAPVVASDAGVVTIAGWSNSGYGNVVMIDHGNGWITVYGHLSQVNVAACQGVGQGQLIGLAGSTGNSTGPHLHFETRLNGGFVNPWSVLSP